MLFAWDITVPAATQESDPVEETLKLSAGVITHIGIKFPAGCHGLVMVRLFHAESQLMPIPRGEWVTGDDEEAEAEYHLEFRKEVELLKVKIISPDTDYGHTITVRITMLPAYVAAPYMIISDFIKIMKRLLGLA